jgi:hypothetical protein
MSRDVDPAVASLFNIAFAFGGFVFCSRCGCEPGHTSTNLKYSEESYHDLAVNLFGQGWRISDTDPLDVFCPQCAAR